MSTILARVYLVRHGETDENRNGIIQGQLDTSLNSLGLEQARLVGNALRSIPIDIAYSSDLSRATNTAETILAHHPSVTAHYKQIELRERYMGDMQGKPVQIKQPGVARDPMIESGAFFAARAETWWMKYILDSTANLPRKTEPYQILVTTHGGFIGTLVRALLHSRRARCADGIVVQRCFNTSVTIIDVEEGGKGVVMQYGDISHLEELANGAVEKNVDENDER